jgi:hypothetical protein
VTFVSTLQKPDTLASTFSGSPVAPPRSNRFAADRSRVKAGFDFMIRYSSYRVTNYPTKSNASTDLLRSLETEYHELKELREQVRKAEAAAAMRKTVRQGTSTKQ